MAVADRYVFEVSGEPPVKNARHKLVNRGGFIGRANSDEFNDLVDVLRAAWGDRPTLASGRWRLTITARWSRKRTLNDGTRVAFADVDAPISSTHDALERAGVFDNDMRIDELVARREYSPARPGLTIVIERVAEQPPT